MSSSSEWEKRVEEQLKAIREEMKQSRHIAPAALSKTEAAQMLSCSTDHIAKMVKNGTLRPRDLDGLERIPVTQILDLLDDPKKAEQPRPSTRQKFDEATFRAATRKARGLR